MLNNDGGDGEALELGLNARCANPAGEAGAVADWMTIFRVETELVECI